MCFFFTATEPTQTHTYCHTRSLHDALPISMDHTPGQQQFVNRDKHRVYYQGKHAMSDAEFERMIVDRKAAQELYSDKHRQILVEMALSADHVLASHDDAPAAHVDEAAGLGLTISAFPTSMAAARPAHRSG